MKLRDEIVYHLGKLSYRLDDLDKSRDFDEFRLWIGFLRWRAARVLNLLSAAEIKEAQNTLHNTPKATICPHYGKEIVNRYTGESEVIHHCRCEGKL
jgi:hypothetical protein